MTNGAAPSGWYQDPTGQGDGRYWNGTSWTESVDRGGVTVNVAIDPSQAQVPPIAGTEVAIPAPAAPATPRRSPVGAILGGVLVVIAIVVIVVLVSNNDSSDDGPTNTDVAPATEAPAPPDTDAPAPPDTGGG